MKKHEVDFTLSFDFKINCSVVIVRFVITGSKYYKNLVRFSFPDQFN